MTVIDPLSVTSILSEIGKAVILPRFCALGKDDVREKHPGDLVTVADTEAERELALRLQALLPGSQVVGEESVAADPDILRLIDQAAPVWIIDPIDGTGNFVRGNSNFAVIVALVRDRTTLQGWIHDPLKQRTVVAIRGQGCWSDHQRLTMAPKPLLGMTGSTAWRDRGQLEKHGLNFRQYGSAAHEYLALLDGSLDFSIYHRLHPWDHAAGVLMVQESGGEAHLLDGQDYLPVPQQNCLLMAPDPQSWAALSAMFSGDGTD